jgi:hypothetical protein
MIKSKHFFFEKKKQKTFGSSLLPAVSTGGDSAGSRIVKVFWFFIKKELLPSCTRRLFIHASATFACHARCEGGNHMSGFGRRSSRQLRLCGNGFVGHASCKHRACDLHVHRDAGTR